MKKLVALALLMLSVAVAALADEPKPPRIYFLDAKALAAEKARISVAGAKDPLAQKIDAIAASSMKVPLRSVMEKTTIPPSGDKHDFLSLAPYWWPDPKNPRGPYIRRDGERNPDAVKVPDRDYIVDVAHAAYNLSLAYYLTANEQYADRAAKLIRTWFLDPATRMNPNLEFGQAIVGRNDGRGAGLIETRHMIRVVDTVGLLHGSKAWTAVDQKGMEDWCTAYLKWLQDSRNGRDEARAENNHGSWYEAQFTAVALFLGKDDLAKEVASKRATKRIGWQIEKDGRQPKELVRTKSMQYSTFNLVALSNLARVSEAAATDLWNYTSKDGRNIRLALDFLVPFVAGEKKWEYQQIAPYDYDEILPVLLLASEKYKDPKYAALAAKLNSTPKDIDVILMTAMRSH